MDPPAQTLTTHIPLDAEGRRHIYGDLHIPRGARGIVLFVHGSGSGRASPRNVRVARELATHGWGTFLIDLLNPQEAREDEWTRALRFDIPLLCGRVVAAMVHLRRLAATARMPVALYGASTGAAAALVRCLLAVLRGFMYLASLHK